MKRKFLLFPFVALMLSLVSCEEPEFNPLVGCWSSERFNPGGWAVYHLISDETGSVEFYTLDTCFKKDEFTWRSTDRKLLLTYKDKTIDTYYYSLDYGVLELYNSERVYDSSYHKKRDCH